MVTYEELIDFLDYDPNTGVFVWKHRAAHHFNSLHQYKVWNGNYEGKVAGTIRPKTGRNRYTVIQVSCKSGKKVYPAHHLAWMYIHKEYPKQRIDHIDGDGFNNRIDNLRLATPLENMRNLRLCTKNKSGIMGVSKTSNGKWGAKIGVNHQTVWLGTHNDFFEACCARKSAESRYGFHENHGQV